MMKNISTRFFGLSKPEVDRYVQELTNKQEKIIDELEQELKWLLKERDKLAAELKEAQKEEVRYEDEAAPPREKADSKLLDDAKNRLEKTVALINMVSDEEAAQLMQNANKKLEEYDRVIESLQADIEEKKKRIEALLSNVLGLLKENADIIPAREKEEQKSSPRAANDSREEQEEQEISETLERLAKDKMTADGTSLSNLSKVLMFRKKQEEAEKEEEAAASRFEVSPKGLPPLDGEYFDYEKELEALAQGGAGLDELEAIEGAGEEEAVTFSEEFKEPFQLHDMAEEADAGQASAPGQERPAPAPAAQSGGNDIKKMRNALIIGKVAGEDITDGAGNVIIQKGKILDDGDITLAEAAAKLPELIINMHLPKE